MVSATSLLLISSLLSQAVESEGLSLVEQLRSTDAEIRLLGLAKFGSLESFGGPSPGELSSAVPLLLDLVDDDDARVRGKAARLMGDVTVDQARAEPNLKRLLNDDAAAVRVAAAKSLWKIFRREDGLSDVVRPLVHSNNPQVRLSATHLLWRLGGQADEVVPEFIRLLDNDNSNVRSVAADVLGEIGPEARAATMPLAKLFRDEEDRDVREPAIRALQRMGEEAKAAIPILVEVLGDDSTIRLFGHWGTSAGEEAAMALAQMGKDGEQALLEALSKEDNLVRAHVLDGLAESSLKSDAVVLRVSPFVLDADDMVQAKACWVLRDYATPLAASGLVGGLKHPDENARDYAARGLGGMGPQAASAVEPLISALQDSDSDVRGRAAEALGRIGARADLVVPELAELVGDRGEVFDLSRKETVSDYAMDALGRFGADAEAAIPLLLSEVPYFRHGTRCAAIKALGKIGPKSSAAVPKLVAAQDKFPVCLALARIAPNDEHVLKTAVAQLGCEYSYRRVDAVRGLRLVAKHNEAAIPSLNQALSDKNANVRMWAAMSLLELSPDDSEALRVFMTEREQISKGTSEKYDTFVRVLQRVIGHIPPTLPSISDHRWPNMEDVDLEILAAHGPRAKHLLPLLLRRATPRWHFFGSAWDPAEHELLIDAIVKISGDSLPELVEALDHDDFVMRQVAAVVLGKTGAKDQKVTRQLVEKLGDRRLAVRVAAAQALGRLRASDSVSVAGLRAMLEDDFFTARRQAAESLEQVGARRGTHLPD